MDLLTKLPVLTVLQEPPIDYTAALYFLEGGHYLFRAKTASQSGSGWLAKFVTSVDVASAFTGSEVDTGWLPAGVVRTGSNAKGKWFVYSTPPQKKEIHFDGEEQPVTIPLPRLVLLGMGSLYYLWALHATHFDSTHTAYHAPFPNVYPDGRICWGANTPKPADPSDARQAWDLFFATPFNRDLAIGKSKAFERDVREQLRALAGKSKYPVDDLVAVASYSGSIGRRIESILGGG